MYDSKTPICYYTRSALALDRRHFELAPGSAPPIESLNVTLQPKDGLLLRLAPLGGEVGSGGEGGEGATPPPTLEYVKD